MSRLGNKIQLSALILALIFGIQQIVPKDPSYALDDPELSLYLFSEIGILLSGAFFLLFAVCQGFYLSYLSLSRSEIFSEAFYSIGIALSLLAAIMTVFYPYCFVYRI